jgi:hypothetical protein
LFSICIRLFNLTQPEIIKSGFECESILALREIFKGSEISGWQFHLGQSVYRKLQKLKLQSLYRTNEIVRKFTKCLSALDLVEVNYLHETFYELKNDINFPISLIQGVVKFDWF